MVVQSGVGEEADLHIFDLGMFNQTRRDLFCADPGHTAEDCVVGKIGAKWFFVAYSVLNDDEGRPVVRNALKERGYGRWINCFMRAHDVVEVRVGVCRGLENCARVSCGSDACDPVCQRRIEGRQDGSMTVPRRSYIS